jgi:hypothetical protein
MPDPQPSKRIIDFNGLTDRERDAIMMLLLGALQLVPTREDDPSGASRVRLASVAEFPDHPPAATHIEVER